MIADICVFLLLGLIVHLICEVEQEFDAHEARLHLGKEQRP